MFRLLRKGDRVLITGKKEDLSLIEQGWVLLGTYRKWERAFREALRLADSEELIVEWYLDEAADPRTLKAAGRQLI
ncbi:MAG: hypothetical protein ABWJ97_06430 [Thermoproteus sp.]